MTTLDPAYGTALLDWLACAVGGREQPAARAARAAGDGLLERVTALGTAGHVLDFDDTYLPGLAHLSAPTAPAALVLGAQLGASVGDVLGAYAAGFEAMAAQCRADHPALYEAGGHPTAVHASAGAAVAASRLLGLDSERERSAVALAQLRAAGLRSAFGGDGKSLQVGMAAASGVHAARLAAAGARVASVDKGVWRLCPETAAPAVRDNWIKAYPCCLQTHGAIECALAAREGGVEPGTPLVVTVHPLSRLAAALDDVADGLQAKFSIPYLTAFALLHGAPRVASFARVDDQARGLAELTVEVRTDPALLESEARLDAAGGEVARVAAALGSPQRPMDAQALAAKVRELAADRLDGALDEPDRPAADLLAAI